MRSGESFLLHDSGDGNPNFRVIMFGTIKFLRLLVERSPTVYSDGTWKSCPPPFDQLYTFHGYENVRSIPLVFCLVKGKAKTTYVYLIEQLKKLALKEFGKEFKPKKWTLDFEQAMLLAIKECLPDCELHACSFHFGQSFIRGIKSYHLFTIYQKCILFNTKFKALCALQFLEEAIVKETFKKCLRTNYFFEDTLALAVTEKEDVQQVGLKQMIAILLIIYFLVFSVFWPHIYWN